MVNIEALDMAIAESGLTIDAICRKTGITRQTLYNRRKNPDSFRIYEIDALREVLSLNAAESRRVFSVYSK